MADAERRHPAPVSRSLGGVEQSNALPVPEGLLEHLAELVAERLAERLPQRPEPYLSVDDAAEYLAAPRSRVYDLVDRGRLTVYRDGRRLLFKREDLDAALEREAAR